MILDGPAETLDVDHKNENQREQNPGRHSQALAYRTQQRCLDDHHLPDLPLFRSGPAQQRQFRFAVQDQGDEGGGHAEYGHGHGDDLQSIGNRKGIVENSKDFPFQRSVGMHENT